MNKLRFTSAILALLFIGAGVPVQQIKGGHRKIFSAAAGAPALGVHASASSQSAPAGVITTSGVTTQASGSSFWVCIEYPTADAPVTITDSKSNTYSQSGANLSGGGFTFARFKTINGTGGSSHTFTTTLTSFPGPISMWAAEIKNSTGGVDQQAVQNTSVSPFDSPAVTTTSANEVILGCATDNSTGAGDNFTAAVSYTLLDQITNGATLITGASIGKAVSSTGTFKTEFTSVQGTIMNVSIDTFK